MWRLNRENKITLFIIKKPPKHDIGMGILINSENQDWAIHIILLLWCGLRLRMFLYVTQVLSSFYFKGFITVKCRPCLNISDCSSSSDFCFYKLSCYIHITDD